MHLHLFLHFNNVMMEERKQKSRKFDFFRHGVNEEFSEGKEENTQKQ